MLKCWALQSCLPHLWCSFKQNTWSIGINCTIWKTLKCEVSLKLELWPDYRHSNLYKLWNSPSLTSVAAGALEQSICKVHQTREAVQIWLKPAVIVAGSAQSSSSRNHRRKLLAARIFTNSFGCLQNVTGSRATTSRSVVNPSSGNQKIPAAGIRIVLKTPVRMYPKRLAAY